MNVSILKSKLDGLAEAIGVKLKRRLPMTIDEMTTAVNEYAPSLQDKRVSPSRGEQTVEADDGFDYDGLGKVTIEAAKLQSKSVTISPAIYIQEATFVADSGYLGLNRVDITVAPMPSLSFPTSTSSSAAGSQIAVISLTNGYRYINIPSGYNSGIRYYQLYVAGMTLPTSASDTSSGTQKAIINASEATKYINIPTGYNPTASYYTIPAISSTYIGSEVKRWYYGDEEVLVPVTVINEYTPVASGWSEDDYWYYIDEESSFVGEYPVDESMSVLRSEVCVTVGDIHRYLSYADIDQDGFSAYTSEYYSWINIRIWRENGEMFKRIELEFKKEHFSLSDIANKPIKVDVFVFPPAVEEVQIK